MKIIICHRRHWGLGLHYEHLQAVVTHYTPISHVVEIKRFWLK